MNFHLHQMNRQHLVLEMCMREVLQLHIANLCPKTQRDLMRKSMNKRGTLKPLLAATHCELVSINTLRSVAKIDG